MKRFDLLTICVFSLVLCVALSSMDAQARRPNIVVIVVDDMGYADIGINGSKDIPTPNIDSLAAVGISFSNAYVSGPYCSPTRAGLMTGRYQQRFGHEFNFGTGPGTGLPTSEVTIADRLKAVGYRTAAIGKWHLGADARFHPMSRGFDEFFGFLGGEHSYLDPEPTGRNPLLDGRFIRRNKSQRFFLYLAYNAVHVPMEATDKYLARFSGIADQQRRTYAAMLSAMDDGIGKTLAALRDANLEGNTLIIFFNDNGGPTMVGTTINGSSNVPLRGSKRQTFEGGIRVPFIIRWKGHLAEGKIDSRPIIQLDVLPTALAAAGVNAQPEWKLDGVNLLPYLTDAVKSLPHEALYWRLGGTMAIRKGEWKLVKTAEGPLPRDPEVLRDLSDAGLYNLAEDIGEKNNLAAKYPAKFRELANDWQRWNAQLMKPRWAPELPLRTAPGGPRLLSSGR